MLNLGLIEQSLKSVEVHWKKIDDELDKRKIGRKDAFIPVIRDRLLVAYGYLDKLLKQRAEPFSKDSIIEMLVLNDKVHYGNNSRLQESIPQPERRLRNSSFRESIQSVTGIKNIKSEATISESSPPKYT